MHDQKSFVIKKKSRCMNTETRHVQSVFAKKSSWEVSGGLFTCSFLCSMYVAAELHLRAAARLHSAEGHRHFKLSGRGVSGLPWAALGGVPRRPAGRLLCVSVSLAPGNPSSPCPRASMRRVDSESLQLRSLDRDSFAGAACSESSSQLQQAAECACDPQELVLLSLLERHQSARCLVRVVGTGEDAAHALLGLRVARLAEEPRERVLANVLEDVGGRALAASRVEAVTAHRRTHPTAVWPRVSRHRCTFLSLCLSLCGFAFESWAFCSFSPVLASSRESSRDPCSVRSKLSEAHAAARAVFIPRGAAYGNCVT